MALFLNQMQKLAKTPLLVAADFERAASMRVTGGTRFPHSMAFGAAGDLAATQYEGLVTAREARALGIHWIFAPVADVNNNPLKPDHQHALLSARIPSKYHVTSPLSSKARIPIPIIASW